MISSDDRVQMSNEKERTNSPDKKNENTVRQKKPGTEEFILHESTYIKVKTRQN